MPPYTFAAAEIFVFMALFARIGSAFLLMPTLGEQYFNERAKLGIALLITLALYPIAPQEVKEAADLPPFHGYIFILGEILTGALIGMLGRMIHAAAHVLGSVISNQAGLTAAAMYDPAQSSQGTMIGTFITLTLTALLFATDMHHLLIRAITESYTLLPAGKAIATDGTAGEMALEVFAGAFKTGIQVSMPYLALGLAAYMMLGVMGRLMPQMQVFFIIVPAQILLVFGLLLISLASLLRRLLEEYYALADGLIA